jgi:hypothetical protein
MGVERDLKGLHPYRVGIGWEEKPGGGGIRDFKIV